jgi:acetylornithine deacetylase/succinyl-diaminopimelate desuccinylase-like protein
MEVDPGRVQVIARLKGTGGGRTLMLNGHMDIDPLPSGMRRDPWQPAIEGDRFYGAGIGNMKGGLASMIVGTLAAKRAGVTRRGDVVVACVVGELQGGVGTVRMLKAGVRADAAIVTEPHGAAHVFTKHAGVMQFAVHVLGKTAHISRKDEGEHAILPREDFAAMFEASLRRSAIIREGQTVEGTIVAIGPEVAFVDVGGKGEAQIDVAELKDDDGELEVAVGDRIQAVVVSTRAA